MSMTVCLGAVRGSCYVVEYANAHLGFDDLLFAGLVADDCRRPCVKYAEAAQSAAAIIDTKLTQLPQR